MDQILAWIMNGGQEDRLQQFTISRFKSDDPGFAGEITMMGTLKAEDSGTTVSILFNDIPLGIRPEDNETGIRLTLDKLVRYVE